MKENSIRGSNSKDGAPTDEDHEQQGKLSVSTRSSPVPSLRVLSTTSLDTPSTPKLSFAFSDSDTDDLSSGGTTTSICDSGSSLCFDTENEHENEHELELENQFSPQSKSTQVEQHPIVLLQQPRLTLTIQGLYTKRVMLRARELPKEYTTSDLAKDQFMCRKRLHTKPLSMDSSSNSSSSSTTTTTTTDNNISNNNTNNKYDTALFKPGIGLTNGYFWHSDQRQDKHGMPDRAILLQSMSHYNHLINHPKYGSSFKDIDIETSPSFGEQVIVDSQGSGISMNDNNKSKSTTKIGNDEWDASKICIGDVFIVEDGRSSLVLEISSPRKPCYAVNKRHGTSMNTTGIKTYTMQNALAGFFARVMQEGELRDGMKLVRVKNPHPKWTLSYVSHVLFVEGIKSAHCKDLAMCRPTWNLERKGGLDELKELVNLPQLGEYEWKEDIEKLLEELVKKEEDELGMVVLMKRKIMAKIMTKMGEKKFIDLVAILLPMLLILASLIVSLCLWEQ